MISDLIISYTKSNVFVTLSTDVDADGNLPYNLASLFARVVKDSAANPDMVIEQLKAELDYVGD